MRQSRVERNQQQKLSSHSSSTRQGLNRKQESDQFKKVSQHKQTFQEQTLLSRVQQYRNGMYNGSISQQQERSGLGLFTWDSGEAYFGEWKNDSITGEGVIFFHEGGFVHGFFRKGVLHGPAFLKYSNGDVYEGFWQNGKLNGNSYKYFSEENCWILSMYTDGNFQKVLSKGNGLPPSYVFKYITSTSDMASRHSKEGNCLQVVMFQDGGQFLGVIENESPSSLGIFRYTDGKYDTGIYQKGNLHGIGRLNLHNGDIYDGFLEEGLFEGKGVFYQKSTGSWIFGDFQSNKCVSVLLKGSGSIPSEVIAQLRREYHSSAENFIDEETPLFLNFHPLSNQLSKSTEKHNFYLDLSNVSNISSNQQVHSSGQIPNYFDYSNKFKLSLSNFQSSPPKSQGQRSISKNSQLSSNKKSMKEVADRSNSSSKTSNSFISGNQYTPKGVRPSFFQKELPKQSAKSYKMHSGSNSSSVSKVSKGKQDKQQLDLQSVQEYLNIVSLMSEDKKKNSRGFQTDLSQNIQKNIPSFHQVSEKSYQIINDESKKSTNLIVKENLDKGAIKIENNSGQILKPNIFQKVNSSLNSKAPQKFKQKQREEEKRQVKDLQNLEKGKKPVQRQQQSEIIISLDPNNEEGEERLRSLSGTPMNQFANSSSQKNQNLLDNESNQKQEDDRSPSFFEEQKDSNEEEQRDSSQINNTNENDSSNNLNNQEDNSLLYQGNNQSNHKTSKSAIELETLKSEIAGYEQIVSQKIPIRTRKTRPSKHHSKEINSSLNSKSNASPASLITPTYTQQDIVYNQQQQASNFQTPSQKQLVQSDQSPIEHEEELGLEESKHVLESIKMIKQQMLSQLHILEDKHDLANTPSTSNAQFLIHSNFNVANEGREELREESEDISPQKTFDNLDNESKAQQKYYSEEDAKLLAEKIERNLTFDQKDIDNTSENTNRQRKGSRNQYELVADETATSQNDVGEANLSKQQNEMISNIQEENQSQKQSPLNTQQQIKESILSQRLSERDDLDSEAHQTKDNDHSQIDEESKEQYYTQQSQLDQNNNFQNEQFPNEKLNKGNTNIRQYNLNNSLEKNNLNPVSINQTTELRNQTQIEDQKSGEELEEKIKRKINQPPFSSTQQNEEILEQQEQKNKKIELDLQKAEELRKQQELLLQQAEEERNKIVNDALRKKAEIERELILKKQEIEQQEILRQQAIEKEEQLRREQLEIEEIQRRELREREEQKLILLKNEQEKAMKIIQNNLERRRREEIEELMKKEELKKFENVIYERIQKEEQEIAKKKKESEREAEEAKDKSRKIEEEEKKLKEMVAQIQKNQEIERAQGLRAIDEIKQELLQQKEEMQRKQQQMDIQKKQHIFEKGLLHQQENEQVEYLQEQYLESQEDEQQMQFQDQISEYIAKRQDEGQYESQQQQQQLLQQQEQEQQQQQKQQQQQQYQYQQQQQQESQQQSQSQQSYDNYDNKQLLQRESLTDAYQNHKLISNIENQKEKNQDNKFLPQIENQIEDNLSIFNKQSKIIEQNILKVNPYEKQREEDKNPQENRVKLEYQFEIPTQQPENIYSNSISHQIEKQERVENIERDFKLIPQQLQSDNENINQQYLFNNSDLQTENFIYGLPKTKETTQEQRNQYDATQIIDQLQQYQEQPHQQYYQQEQQQQPQYLLQQEEQQQSNNNYSNYLIDKIISSEQIQKDIQSFKYDQDYQIGEKYDLINNPILFSKQIHEWKPFSENQSSQISIFQEQKESLFNQNINKQIDQKEETHKDESLISKFILPSQQTFGLISNQFAPLIASNENTDQNNLLIHSAAYPQENLRSLSPLQSQNEEKQTTHLKKQSIIDLLNNQPIQQSSDFTISQSQQIQGMLPYGVQQNQLSNLDSITKEINKANPLNKEVAICTLYQPEQKVISFQKSEVPLIDSQNEQEKNTSTFQKEEKDRILYNNSYQPLIEDKRSNFNQYPQQEENKISSQTFNFPSNTENKIDFIYENQNFITIPKSLLDSNAEKRSSNQSDAVKTEFISEPKQKLNTYTLPQEIQVESITKKVIPQNPIKSTFSQTELFSSIDKKSQGLSIQQLPNLEFVPNNHSTQSNLKLKQELNKTLEKKSSEEENLIEKVQRALPVREKTSLNKVSQKQDSKQATTLLNSNNKALPELSSQIIPDIDYNSPISSIKKPSLSKVIGPQITSQVFQRPKQQDDKQKGQKKKNISEIDNNIKEIKDNQQQTNRILFASFCNPDFEPLNNLTSSMKNNYGSVDLTDIYSKNQQQSDPILEQKNTSTKKKSGIKSKKVQFEKNESPSNQNNNNQYLPSKQNYESPSKKVNFMNAPEIHNFSSSNLNNIIQENKFNNTQNSFAQQSINKTQLSSISVAPLSFNSSSYKLSGYKPEGIRVTTSPITRESSSLNHVSILPSTVVIKQNLQPIVRQVIVNSQPLQQIIHIKQSNSFSQPYVNTSYQSVPQILNCSMPLIQNQNSSFIQPQIILAPNNQLSTLQLQSQIRPRFFSSQSRIISQSQLQVQTSNSLLNTSSQLKSIPSLSFSSSPAPQIIRQSPIQTIQRVIQYQQPHISPQPPAMQLISSNSKIYSPVVSQFSTTNVSVQPAPFQIPQQGQIIVSQTNPFPILVNQSAIPIRKQIVVEKKNIEKLSTQPSQSRQEYYQQYSQLNQNNVQTQQNISQPLKKDSTFKQSDAPRQDIIDEQQEGICSIF